MNILYIVILIILYLLINVNREYFTVNDIPYVKEIKDIPVVRDILNIKDLSEVKDIPLVKYIINYGENGIENIKVYFTKDKNEMSKKNDTSECSFIKSDNYNINYNYNLKPYDKKNNYYYNNI